MEVLGSVFNFLCLEVAMLIRILTPKNTKFQEESNLELIYFKLTFVQMLLLRIPGKLQKRTESILYLGQKRTD